MVEQRERLLRPLVADEPLQPRQLQRLGELLGGEVRRADGTDRPRADELVERLERLLLRRVRIEVVRHVERDPLQSEATPALVDLPEDAGPRQPLVAALLHRVEGLRGHDHAVANRRSARREPLADDRLAPAAAVGVGRVERRDPELPGLVEEPKRVLARRALPEEARRGADPAEVAAAEDHARDRDPAAAEGHLLHGPIVRGASARRRGLEPTGCRRPARRACGRPPCRPPPPPGGDR